MVCVVWQICTTVPLIHWYLSTKLQDISKKKTVTLGLSFGFWQ